jgi:allophanate hydrolase
LTSMPLRTLADWRSAMREGHNPAPLLRGRLAAIRAESPAAAWIHLASDAELDAQLDRLAARAAACIDRAAAVATMPLFGVPFAVKDNIDIEGVPTTAACPAFAHLAPRSAGVVQRLTQAGAVWLGKTNLDQFATGLVGTRSPYGRPSSVADPQRISGGSSSGSAVSVARGDVAFALGTDTAGSGRVPAGFNGIVGLKPTPGRVGTSGVVPACRTLDCVSIFAHATADAAQILALLEGDDADDAFSAFALGPAGLPQRPRVGVPAAPEFFGDAGYDPAWALALERLRAIGAEPVMLDFGPLHETAELLYGGPWVAERHAVVQDLLDGQPQAFDPTVRRIIEGARRFSATDTFRAQYRLRDAQRRHSTLWQGVDALMVPTAPGHPRFEEVDADPVGLNARLGRYTNFVNLLGWCALAVPAGRCSSGLPFGVTFILPGAHDAALARFGVLWEQGDEAAPRPTGPWPRSQPTVALAVVGAHLSGLPLNPQLLERGAVLRVATQTAPHYRLHALPGTTPAKPGLLRVAHGGAAIAVEVWDVPQREVGSFLAGIASPLCLGTIDLADGQQAHGFLCEGHALAGAPDISAFGGWRAYLAAQAGTPAR